jgi:hypothetical protein
MKTCLLLLVVGVLLTSCSPVLYSPVGQNVPLFTEPGQVAFSGGYCSSDVSFFEIFGGNYAEGISVQGAAAVHKKVAIGGSFYSMRGREDSDASASISGHGWYWELAGGSFGVFRNPLFQWEVFGGTGFGTIQNTIDGESLNLAFFKPYIQPSVALNWKFIEFAFTPKLAIINYTGHTNEITDPDQREMAEAYFRSNQSKTSFEPGFTLRVGMEHVKLQFQTCYSSRQYAGWEGEPAINSMYVSLGAFCRLGKKKEKEYDQNR